MKKVLLTSVFQPFGVENRYNKKGDDFLLDYLASRLTREPGMFALSSYVPHSGLHLIAANLPCESKVLEYPTIEEFIDEIKKGYDYIGINFLIKGLRKVYHMVSLIRKYSPSTKIIIGGFGTILHETDQIGADYVCKGEGVQFMREVMGLEPAGKYVHPVITAEVTLKVFQGHDFMPQPRMGLITSGFGCPNACEFCCTSAYYKHQNIPFLKSGREIYRAMVFANQQTKGVVKDFLIFEEDMMLYQPKVTELSQELEEHDGIGLSYGCFASLRAISKYDLEGLVAGGLSHVWIGIESKHPPFEKRQSDIDIKEMFKRLHSLGVTTTGSSIFGLEHHTPDNIWEEVEYVKEVEPCTVQLSNLMPGEGTALRERLERENRIYQVGFKDADLYSEIIAHPNFERGQIVPFILKGYEDIYESLGPSLFRIMRTWFAGYKNLHRSPRSGLRKRAEIYARKTRSVAPIFFRTQRFLPNDAVREAVKETLDEVCSMFPPRAEDLAFSGLVEKIFELEVERQRFVKPGPIEPKPIITCYDREYYERNLVNFL